MAELKTKKTTASVQDFIQAITNESQRADAQQILDLMREITGEPPAMWGPSIIGFGSYHYRYESGHEGDMCQIGFSPRKANLALYILPGLDSYADLLARLGKHKTGKSCLYIKRLADIDLATLRELIERAVKNLRNGTAESTANGPPT